MRHHIEVFAEEGGAHMAHQLDEVGKALVAVRHVRHQRDAFDDQRFQPCGDLGFVRHQFGLREAGDVGVVIGIPRPARQVGRIVAALAFGIVGQPCQRVAAGVVLPVPCDFQRTIDHFGAARARCGVEVEDIEHALARLAVERSRAVVAQPIVVEVGGLPAGQEDFEARFSQSDGRCGRSGEVHGLPPLGCTATCLPLFKPGY